MLTTFLRWFRAPRFPADEDKTRRALLLNILLNTFIIALPVIIIGVLLGGFVPRYEVIIRGLIVAWLLVTGLRYMMLAGWITMAGMMLVGIIFLLTTFSIYNLGTIRAPATAFYFLVVVTAGLIVSQRAILWMAGLSTITVIGLLNAEIRGLLPAPDFSVRITQGVTFSVAMVIISILLFLAVKSIDEALTRVRLELAGRHHSEEKLRAGEERFRAMIENISDAIALVDEQAIIHYISPTAERILGYSSAERIGFSAFDNLAQAEDVRTLKHTLEKLQAVPNAKRSFALQARHKDGSLHWLEATATNLLDLPGVQAIVVNYRDVTERIRAEKEREKYIEELGKQNAELERFTYTVSHDLRNPLVTIKGFLGALEKDLRDGRQDRLQSDFRRIAGAADKMDSLLSELLELSRIGRIINPPEEVDLVLLTQEAIETLDAWIRASGITIKIAPNLPCVYGDRVRLREVFEHLIDNAAKYMGDQPTPIVEVGKRAEENPIFFVKDNGIGIESQYCHKIFGLFEKLDPTIEGTGIGLALVKRIIEVHGGRIWAESDGLGKGSTFCFTIPDNRKTQQVAE
jgi:PAS domain S-box-containing protein